MISWLSKVLFLKSELNCSSVAGSLANPHSGQRKGVQRYGKNPEITRFSAVHPLPPHPPAALRPYAAVPPVTGIRAEEDYKYLVFN